MKKLKRLIKRYFQHFSYFYQHLRYRMFVSLGLSFFVGLFDGIGLAMFLPLLSLVSGNNQIEESELGGMSFILNAFERVGLDLTLISVIAVIIIFFFLKGLLVFIRGYYAFVVRLYFIRKLRFENIDLLSTYKYKSFVTADAGHIQNTMSGEVGRVTNAYKSYFNTLQAWIMMLVYVSLAFISNPQFALLVAVGAGLSNLIYSGIYKKTKESSLRISVGGHGFQGLLIQIVAFFKYLKATGWLAEYGEKLKEKVLYIEQAQRKIGVYNALLASSREPLIITIVMSVMIIQIHFFSASLGGMILTLMFFYRALTYIIGIQNSWNSFLGDS